MLNKLESGVHAINGFNTILLVAAIASMFVLLMLQIFSRFLFHFPMVWASDLIVFLLISTVFLGSGAATAKGKQIKLDFLIDLCKKETARKIQNFSDVISILFLLAISYQAAVLGMQATRTTVGASPIPLAYYYWAVGFGCFVMMLNFVVLLIKRLKKLPVMEKK